MTSWLVLPAIFAMIILVPLILYRYLKSKNHKNLWQIMGIVISFLSILLGIISNIIPFPIQVYKEIARDYNDRIASLETKIERLKTQLSESEKKYNPEFWTVMGNVKTENPSNLMEVKVGYLPPSPGVVINRRSGHITLYSVMICKARGWPTLEFECEGYSNESYEIKPETAEINAKSKQIRLKNSIIFERKSGDIGRGQL
jgi:hypothetical protein